MSGKSLRPTPEGDLAGVCFGIGILAFVVYEIVRLAVHLIGLLF